MMALWMAYAVAVATLVAGAAAATERTLLVVDRPVRGVWMAALAASVALPALALLLGSAPLQWTLATLGQGVTAGSATADEGFFRLSLSGGEGAVGTGSALLRSVASYARELDGPLAVTWGLLSLLVGGRLLRESWHLRRSRRTRWRSAREGPFRVLVTPATGPAVTGGLHPEIVVPAWFGEMEEDLRRAALRHENEHRRAGDPWLLAAARNLLVLMPWNPALWWIVGRLRHAVELDCDRRVLSRGTDPATYGRLLVRVSRLSRGRQLLGAVPLGEKESHLERRIRTMSNKETSWRKTKAVAGIAAASVALVLACEAPPPGLPGAAEEETPALAGDQGPESPGAEGAPLRRSEVDSARISFAAEDDGEPLNGRITLEGSGARLHRETPGTAGTDRTDPALQRQNGQTTFSDVSLTERPLVVVDGAVQTRDASLSEINSLDIQRIEIIKGAEARERYGERGAGGVVLIQTRDGGS